MTYRGTIFVLVMLAIASILPGVATADSPPNGEDYVVQADDWLSKLADKFYGDPLAYLIIFDGTNAKATEDDSYAPIADPNIIEIGQKLFIPQTNEISEELAATVQQEDTVAMPVTEPVTMTGPSPEQEALLAKMPSLGTPPELFNEVWLNSEPLKLQELQGKVVLIDFWTFG